MNLQWRSGYLIFRAGRFNYPYDLRPKATASERILELKTGSSQLAGRFTRMEMNGLATFYAIIGDELLLAFGELREFSRGLI